MKNISIKLHSVYLEEFVVEWFAFSEMNTDIRVQTLAAAVCISRSANTIRKGKNPTIFPPDTSKC